MKLMVNDIADIIPSRKVIPILPSSLATVLLRVIKKQTNKNLAKKYKSNLIPNFIYCFTWENLACFLFFLLFLNLLTFNISILFLWRVEGIILLLILVVVFNTQF